MRFRIQNGGALLDDLLASIEDAAVEPWLPLSPAFPGSWFRIMVRGSRRAKPRPLR